MSIDTATATLKERRSKGNGKIVEPKENSAEFSSDRKCSLDDARDVFRKWLVQSEKQTRLCYRVLVGETRLPKVSQQSNQHLLAWFSDRSAHLVDQELAD
jgi:hypothetical protein